MPSMVTTLAGVIIVAPVCVSFVVLGAVISTACSIGDRRRSREAAAERLRDNLGREQRFAVDVERMFAQIDRELSAVALLEDELLLDFDGEDH